MLNLNDALPSIKKYLEETPLKKNLIAFLTMTLLGLVCCTSAMAELKPFYRDSGNEYHCGYKNDIGKVIVPINTYDACGYSQKAWQ